MRAPEPVAEGVAQERPKPSNRRRLRLWLRALKNEDASPNRLGLAVAVGVIIGCSPFYGLQILMSLAVAWLFRMNRIAVLLGANISMPPLTPFVILAGIQVGEYVLHGKFLPLTLDFIRNTAPRVLLHTFALDLLVGGLIVGSVLGGALGFLTARVVGAQRARRGELSPELSEDELDSLAVRLAKASRRYRMYAYWKVRLDPVYPLTLQALEGRQELLDLGAGMGLLAALAGGRLPHLRIRAVEWDAGKVQAAQSVLSDLPNVSVEQADARTVELGTPDALTLLDVLHYFPPAEQRAWVERCCQALAPGGLLLIRELDSSRGRLAEVVDRWAVRTGWNKGPGVQAWAIPEIVSLLEGAGLRTRVLPAGKGLFKANALIMANKPPTGV